MPTARADEHRLALGYAVSAHQPQAMSIDPRRVITLRSRTARRATCNPSRYRRDRRARAHRAAGSPCGHRRRRAGTPPPEDGGRAVNALEARERPVRGDLRDGDAPREGFQRRAFGKTQDIEGHPAPVLPGAGDAIGGREQAHQRMPGRFSWCSRAHCSAMSYPHRHGASRPSPGRSRARGRCGARHPPCHRSR